MKTTFFQVSKKEIFLELGKKLAYGFNIKLSQIFSIDQDII